MVENENRTDDKAFSTEIKIGSVSKKNFFATIVEVGKVGEVDI